MLLEILLIQLININAIYKKYLDPNVSVINQNEIQDVGNYGINFTGQANFNTIIQNVIQKVGNKGINSVAPFTGLARTIPLSSTITMMERVTSITYSASQKLSFHFNSPPQIVSKIVYVSMVNEE